jgi:hypothetical protein
MTIQELKTATLESMTAEYVRQTWGDLRKRSTWESAYSKAQEIAAATAQALTSAQAKAIYEVIANVVLIVVIGLWLAAVHNWRAWVKPGAIAAGQRASDKAQAEIARAMLTHYGM